jgi:hypothetical protein
MVPSNENSQVKTAYMKLSLQLHPDKNPECKDCAAKFSKATSPLHPPSSPPPFSFIFLVKFSVL